MFTHRSEQMEYKLLIQSVTDHAIFMLDVEGRVRSWNPGAERIKGYREADILGRHFSVFYGPDERAAGLPERCLAAARATGRIESQGWRLRQDGSRFWARIVIHAVRENGDLVGFVKITRDCSEERRHAAALETMAGNLRVALSFLPYGACLLDADRRIVLFNPPFQALFATAEKGVSLPDLVRRHIDDPNLLSDDLERATSEGDGEACDLVLGSMTVALRMKKAQGFGWVATFEDVTAPRRALRRLLSGDDGMAATAGLADGAGLRDHVGRTIAGAGAGDCAVLMLDLDHVGTIGDIGGHRPDRLVIAETVRRILLVLRPEDFVCRVGDAAFVVVPAAPAAAEQAARLAARLREHLYRPYAIGPRQQDVVVSIGYAAAPARATSTTELLAHADVALHEAKRDGRGRICRFTEELGIAVLKRRSLEGKLRQALKTGEFSLAYQPICSTRTLETRGFEALLRWRQADGSQVSPMDFVPVAEELDLMGEIGAWVLAAACRQAVTWPAPLRLAVNVSPTQIRRDFVGRVRAALAATGLAPSRLELEITETAMLQDCALSASILEELRAMGISIAIDDFGTGYSSLSFLQTLPSTRIKIDRSFVKDIIGNAASRTIIRGMMQISQGLALSVTAEGVETELQRRALMAHGCEEMQGFLVAKPMAPERIAAFMRAHAHADGIFERTA